MARVTTAPVERRRLALAAPLLLIAAAGSLAAGADRLPFHSQKAFRDALEQHLSATWEQVDLRTISRRLEETRRVALLIDRRLDPSQPLQFAARDLALRDLLDQLARDRQAAATIIGNCVYLGPPDAAGRLRTLVTLRTQELADLAKSSKSHRGLTRPATFAWDDVSAPQDLVQQLADRQSVEIRGRELVPHDLWAAATLPDATFTEALSLILIQFDLTFAWEQGGSAVRLEPAPTEVVIEKRHAAGRGGSQALLERIQEQFPQVAARIAGTGVVVAGTVEQQEAIEQLRDERKAPDKNSGSRTSRKDKPRAGAAETRFTLRMQDKPLGSLLKTLERPEHGGWTFEFDEAELKQAGIRLDRRITFDVKEVSLTELLSTALDQAGLTFEKDDRTIRLRPR